VVRSVALLLALAALAFAGWRFYLRPQDNAVVEWQGYVEGDRTAPDLVAEGFDPAVVDQVVRLVDGAEYKRRQMPPGVRITTKAFGKDRRMPITNHYRPPLPEEPRSG